MRVLLSGGYASGRLVTVDDNASVVEVPVTVPYDPNYPNSIRPTSQRYSQTIEISTSGFQVWEIVIE